jgi:predicted acylesterase/phospholipase RssA
MESRMTDVFAVFEGGGVKGIAHVGALARFHEEEELQFRGYAGTSAGAIVAALAAVGYRARNPSSPPSSITPQDLNMIMAQLDFDKS